MAQSRTGFELEFEGLSADPALGAAALVPWDSAIFGFAVATFRAGPAELEPRQADDFRREFAARMRTNRITLCSATLDPTRTAWRQVLPQVGFQFVDLGLQVTLALASAKLPAVRTELRRARLEDHETIEAIAAKSFSHGRYHADPRFPKQLADRRYQRWVRNALTAPGEVDRMYVLEQDGKVAGFYHVTLEGDVSDLRLAAVAPESKTTMVGVELYAAMLHELRREKVRRVVTSISAMNLNVVNLFSMLGFRFSSPEIIYHWHADGRVEP
jgi:hypothetical protein